MRLTVAGETPSSAAIALPVQRRRRRSPTRATTVARVGLRRRCGRDERSSRPASPSARQRATHLRTVLTQSPKAVATAFGLCPCSTTRRTSSARLRGVRRAFLWTSIRPSRESEASQPQLPRPGPNGQPTESSQLAHREPRGRAERDRAEAGAAVGEVERDRRASRRRRRSRRCRPRPARDRAGDGRAERARLLGDVEHGAPVAGAEVEAALGEAVGVGDERRRCPRGRARPIRARACGPRRRSRRGLSPSTVRAVPRAVEGERRVERQRAERVGEDVVGRAGQALGEDEALGVEGDVVGEGGRPRPGGWRGSPCRPRRSSRGRWRAPCPRSRRSNGRARAACWGGRRPSRAAGRWWR